MLGDHEKYGDTYAQWGGPIYTILTRDPQNIRAILSGKFKNFEIGAGRHGCVTPLLGDGIFTQDGPKWEHSRKLLAPLIQRSTLPDLKLIEKHYQRLLTKIADASGLTERRSDHGPVNLKGPLFELSLEITTEFLLGELADSIVEDSTGGTSVWADAFAQEFNTAFRWIAKRERLKSFYWMINSKEFKDSCASARKLVEQMIHRSIEAFEGRSKSKETYIALAPLLQDDANVAVARDQFLNLLLAGRDTNGSLLCWIFYSLSRDPKLFKLLKEEVAAVLETMRQPTKSDLARMTQLDHFITESMSSILTLSVFRTMY
ncbi:MAG: Protein kinase alk2 [Bathelium mastoideum]|nr:MAG: Protein kinase alk2 [Bathelium mastoideum]